MHVRLPYKAPQGALFVLLPCIASLLLALAVPVWGQARTETAAVRHVVDGDSVILADDRPVRLIGINAPEFGRDSAPDQPLAVAARDRLRALVEGRPVRLDYETENRDRYGRWLAHLKLADGTSAEEHLLRDGLAWAVAIPPNIRDQARHAAAEAEARSAGRGVWGHSYYAPREADALTAADSGFRLVRGRVTHVGSSRKFVYLDMAPRFALRIGRHDWERYFRGRPEDWRGTHLEVRGWISVHDGRLYQSVGHPAMLRRLP